MSPEDEDAEREVRAAIAALERALERVRRARRDSVGVDVQEVRAALDGAENWLKRAQARLQRARQRAGASADVAGQGDGVSEDAPSD